MNIQLFVAILFLITGVYGMVNHTRLTRYIQDKYPEIVKHIIGKDKFPEEYWWTSEIMKVVKYASSGDDIDDEKLIFYKKRVKYAFRILWILFTVHILLIICH